MLIQELMEDADIELQHAVEDILLRARKGNIKNLNLDDIIGELNKTFLGSIYLNPNDEEFKQDLTNILRQSDWVSGVMPTGSVTLKDPSEVGDTVTEPGDEIQRQQDRQQQQVQRSAMQKVKKDEL